MINIIKGKKISSTDKLKIDTGFKKVIIDLGCGDGKQTYKMAYDHPENFYIGIDSNFKGLEEISRKISKKPAKGGLNNIMYIHGVAEMISEDLESIADEIQINFPWGSLLEGVITGEEDIINNIKMLAKNEGGLIIMTTYDDKYEESFRRERGLPDLSQNYFENELKNKLLSFGIKINEVKILTDEDKLKIQSPWGKKILSTRDRDVFEIKASIYK